MKYKSIRYLAIGFIAGIALAFQLSASADLAPGEYQPGADMHPWTSEARGGTIATEGTLRPVLIIKAVKNDDSPRVYAPLEQAAPGTRFEVILYGHSNTSRAYLGVGGSLPGESKSAPAIAWSSGDGELDELRVTYEMGEAKAFVSFGILEGAGTMQVDNLIIRELSADADEARGNALVIPVRDQSRKEALIIGLERQAGVAEANASNAALPPELREQLSLTGPQAVSMAEALAGAKASEEEADRLLSQIEKVTILYDGELNPERISIAPEQGDVHLTLINLISESSVWCRIESNSASTTFRQVLPESEQSFALNEANLINLPPGEPVQLVIVQASVGSDITIYPLDHFGTDVHRVLAFAQRSEQ